MSPGKRLCASCGTPETFHGIMRNICPVVGLYCRHSNIDEGSLLSLIYGGGVGSLISHSRR